ncbi:MAG TPA: amino acid ABC transporter permease [Sulfurospirillum arcachonense]|nr:amino acid ABC transporter permease [Sulfurospirillum arcachonense]HIP45863.1 amino acid ABC transporter permease [Sulfurospirillum arcachonense]
MLNALRNRKVRGILFQLLTVLGLVAFLWYIGSNTMHNIEQRGIKTGFAFLDNSAGFGISEAPVAYTETDTHGRVFFVGLLNTLIVSFYGIIFATILGILIGVLRLSNNWLIRKLSSAYIDIFRNIPLLLQILFWYNVVLKALPSPKQSMEFKGDIFLNNRGLIIPSPDMNSTTITIIISFLVALVSIYFLNRWAKKKQEDTGNDFPTFLVSIGILVVLPILAYFIGGANFNFDIPALKGFNFVGGKTISPEFLALTLALVIYTATFIAEAVRSGIEAVNKGQKEAAASIGLSSYQSLKLVVLPQAIRIAIPPVINQYLNLIKNSSLAAAIGYPEIVTLFSGTSLNQVGQAIEIIAITMLVYLTMSISVSVLLNWLNHKIKIKER